MVEEKVSLSKLRFEVMLVEAKNIVNRIKEVFSKELTHIDLLSDANRYPAFPLGTANGWIQIQLIFANGYGAYISWSEYSSGGSKLLWELQAMYDDDGAYLVPNQFDGYLTSTDILDTLARLSRY